MSRRPAVTMKDVAQRAGVSLSTVSYVLSGARSISDATRVKILRTMDELNFHPNAVARALASRRSRVIGLLLSPQERGLGLSELEFVRGASQTARTLDHHLVLLTEGMDSKADLLHLQHQGLVDGLVLMEVRLHDPRLVLLQDLGLPFTIIGRPDPALNLPFVDIDFDRTVAETLRYLADLGHRAVGFINQSREVWASGYGPAVRAWESFRGWAGTLGLTVSMEFSHSTPRDGHRASEALLTAVDPPTAFVVMNEGALPGVFLSLADRGWRVPQDLSVVSMATSARAAEMMWPALTSADAPGFELARLAVENLVTLIDRPAVALTSSLIPCRLSIRASTAPPRRAE